MFHPTCLARSLVYLLVRAFNKRDNTPKVVISDEQAVSC
jgi:hypothetical protein